VTVLEVRHDPLFIVFYNLRALVGYLMPRGVAANRNVGASGDGRFAAIHCARAAGSHVAADFVSISIPALLAMVEATKNYSDGESSASLDCLAGVYDLCLLLCV